MKKLSIAIISLIILSFAATAIMIGFMPDQVPIHYNAAGEIDSIGSRYTYFIFPAFSALSGLIMLPLAKSRPDKNEGKVLMFTALFMVLLFAAMGIFFSLHIIPDAAATGSSINSSVFKITFILLGILIAFVGNFMPKIRKNHISGLRTKWSLSSDSVWQKSNRFSGIAGVICGILMVICSALLSSTLTLIVVNTALIVMWAVISSIVSYKHYKNEHQKD